MEAEDYGQPMLSIVVPAFNEASRIGDSIRKIDAFMRQLPFSCELIVVDDGSVDNTAEVVRQAQVQGLRLVRNESNHGKGYTVRQGVLAATGKYVLFTDADLSAPIEGLNKLMDVATHGGVDVVIGSQAIDRKCTQMDPAPELDHGWIHVNLLFRVLLA